MAIKKVFLTTYGVNAEYWKITSVYLIEDREQNKAEITLSGFTDAKTSESGDPLSKVTFIWRGDDYPYKNFSGNVKAIAYNKIKLSDDFKDGTDV